MNKRLSAKIQQLNAPAVMQGRTLSSCINVEPEDQNQALKKGVIYGVFNIASSEEIDAGLIKTIIQDALKESYFQSDSISPIQSLEKAIIDVKEKVTHVLIKSPENKVQFNILTGVLWGNVLYVVQFGDGSCFLVRQGEIRPINTMSEGSFAAASGVVKDEDVVIFSTRQFADKYPPSKLLSMAISEQSLLPEESCALLKFIVDTSFTEEEVIHFGPEEAGNGKNKVKELVGKIADKAKETGSRLKRERKPKPSNEQTTSIRLKPERKTKMGMRVAIPILLVGLAVSIFFTVKNRNASNESDTTDQPSEVKSAETVDENKEIPPAAETNESVFYDIKIADTSADPTEIEVFDNLIVVADKLSGKIYTSETQTAKFDVLEKQFAGIRSLKNSEGELFFSDNEGFKYFDLTKKEVSQSFAQSPGAASSTYLGYIYTARDGFIYKYTESGTGSEATLQEASWGELTETENAKSMAIAYNIYLLTNSGKLEVYTSGDKAVFEITGLETPISSASEVVTDPDFDNIYIADSGNKRVVIIDKNGKFVKEIKSPTSREWDTLKNLAVTPDESKLYVLNGSKVYEVAL